MNKKEKATFIIRTLNKLYPDPAIPLKHKDAFTLLVSVLLSAQCTDKKVNEVTPALFKMADNPKKMAQQSPEKIRAIIKPCGLSPTKSKAIYNLSKILIDKFNGEVPNDIQELETLPGVGHKTASVVMSQVFGVPSFPVDTHIHRLLWRWGISNGKNVETTEKDAKRLFPKESWNKLHLQIIYYGREYSPAKGYDLERDIITKTIGRRSFVNGL